MKDKNFLNDLASRLSKALPDSVQKMQKDLEKNFHVILQSAFNKMDLVTRDEFDAQTKVLARSRKKIDELEASVKALEKHMKKNK
jgi:BMFP domain-containing protein YqiC